MAHISLTESVESSLAIPWSKILGEEMLCLSLLLRQNGHFPVVLFYIWKILFHYLWGKKKLFFKTHYYKWLCIVKSGILIHKLKMKKPLYTCLHLFVCKSFSMGMWKSFSSTHACVCTSAEVWVSNSYDLSALSEIILMQFTL